MRFFEDIEIGSRREIGSFTFTADDIKKFAAQFDPQRFHLDEEAGRQSLFGGLGRVRLARRRGLHEASRRGRSATWQERQPRAARTIAAWGPSPGFRELRWTRPVLAGDTIRFCQRGRNQAHLG